MFGKMKMNCLFSFKNMLWFRLIEPSSSFPIKCPVIQLGIPRLEKIWPWQKIQSQKKLLKKNSQKNFSKNLYKISKEVDQVDPINAVADRVETFMTISRHQNSPTSTFAIVTLVQSPMTKKWWQIPWNLEGMKNPEGIERLLWSLREDNRRRKLKIKVWIEQVDNLFSEADYSFSTQALYKA